MFKNLLLLVLTSCLMMSLACGSDEEDKPLPTAMQLIQGKWILNSSETLEFNRATEVQNDPQLKEKLARIKDKQYAFRLTPLAFYLQINGQEQAYAIKSVSDNGTELVLAIQPQHIHSRDNWTNYTFTLENDMLILDIPGEVSMVFEHLAP